MSKLVHCKKSPYDVYVGRPSVFGNPFEIGVHGNRDEVIEKYELMLIFNPELMRQVKALIGLTLGCWCFPKKCHGEVLIQWAKWLQDEKIERIYFLLAKAVAKNRNDVIKEFIEKHKGEEGSFGDFLLNFDKFNNMRLKWQKKN